MAEQKYRVIGTATVAGVKPGGTVTKLPAGTNVRALIKAGHLEPVAEPKTAKRTEAKP